MEDYILDSNREYGEGRPDLVLIPRDNNKRAYILEFKNEYTTSARAAAEAAEEALQQINDRQYEAGLKKTGVAEIVKMGLGFKGKEVAVEWQEDYQIKRKDKNNRISETESASKYEPAKNFTKKQGQYLAFIHYYTKLHKRPPAESDLQRYFEVTPPTVHDMIVRLEDKGLISKKAGKPRTIRVQLPVDEIPELE